MTMYLTVDCQHCGRENAYAVGVVAVSAAPAPPTMAADDRPDAIQPPPGGGSTTVRQAGGRGR